MDFNYKIIFAILLSLIVGYVIYIYFFRKPVTYGEKLKDVQAQQLILQHELLHPPKIIETLEEPAEAEADDDNLTRESLYEEILKLNVLKNPVDFLYKFDIKDLINVTTSSRIEEYTDVLEAETADLEEVEKNETAEMPDYPQDSEPFGKMEEANLNEDDISKKIFSDMLNMDKEEKELELTVPKKKKIVIKKK